MVLDINCIVFGRERIIKLWKFTKIGHNGNWKYKQAQNKEFRRQNHGGVGACGEIDPSVAVLTSIWVERIAGKLLNCCLLAAGRAHHRKELCLQHELGGTPVWPGLRMLLFVRLTFVAYQLPVFFVSDGLYRHQDFRAFEAGLLKMAQLRLIMVENTTTQNNS